MNPIIIIIALVALFLLSVFAFIISRTITVGASEALIVSGAAKGGEVKVVPPGGRTFVLPIIQSSQRLSLAQRSIGISLEDGLDEAKVPVSINAVATVKVGSDTPSIRAAAERYLGSQNPGQEITKSAGDILYGALRDVAGRMSISNLISDREAFGREVYDAAVTKVSTMGLSIESFQITNISDPNGYIENLGAPEAERARMEARRAKALNERAARDAEVTSASLIAERERDLSLKRSILRAETDRAEAEAAAAGPLAAAVKEREIAAVEAEAAQARAVLREKQLETEVRKPADAERYAREQSAEASKFERLREAEAEAEATHVRARAEASAVRTRGEAEAAASQAVGLAKAAAMDAQAQAYANYGQAAIIQIIMENLPQVAHELAAPMSEIKQMTVVSTDGAGALPRAVANNFSQLEEIVGALTGANLKDLVTRFAGAEDQAAEKAAAAERPVAVSTGRRVDTTPGRIGSEQ